MCRFYGVTSITGDRYASGWPPDRFAEHGVTYVPCEQSKSELYTLLLPKLNTGPSRIQLLDLPILHNQLVSLERRTGRGTGRDVIDHPPKARDDVANCVSLLMNLCIGGDERSVIVRKFLLNFRAAVA
jgi:hypothetical protein